MVIAYTYLTSITNGPMFGPPLVWGFCARRIEIPPPFVEMAEPHDHIAVLTRLASPDQNARNRQSWSRGVFLRCSLLPFSASHSMQILEHKCSPLSESPTLPGRNSSVKCTLYCNAGAERLPPRYANRNICQSGISGKPKPKDRAPRLTLHSALPESRPVWSLIGGCLCSCLSPL